MEYEGVISGIGDKETSKNLISPYMDAAVYDFIINHEPDGGYTDIIRIDGFEIDTENKILTGGTLCYRGFRGVIDTSMPLENAERIYAVFDTIENEFSILMTNEYYDNANTDILATPNKYYLILYLYGGDGNYNPQFLPYNYPINSYNCDYALTVKETVGADATGTTQPVNDNSTKIATTEYVKNQIDEDINYGEAIIDMTISGQKFGEIKLKRKSKIVTGQIIFTQDQYTGGGAGIIFQIPDGFLPKGIIYVGAIYQNTLGSSVQESKQIFIFQITGSGSGTVLYIVSEDAYEKADIRVSNIGWETN